MNSFFTNKTVAITGGSDGIGRALVETLLNAGHRVIIVDNLHTGNTANIPVGATFYQADIQDPRDRCFDGIPREPGLGIWFSGNEQGASRKDCRGFAGDQSRVLAAGPHCIGKAAA